VDIEFNPKVTSYEKILDIFWKSHDPFKKSSNQYMSVIFYNNDEQKKMAKKSMEEFGKKFARPIKTEILPLNEFYSAETYHQKYLLQRHPRVLGELDMDPADLENSHVACRLNGYLGGYGTTEELKKEIDELWLPTSVLQYVINQIPKNKRSATGC